MKFRYKPVYFFSLFIISCVTQKNHPPEIENFRVTPSWGDAPLIAELTWKISDTDIETIQCLIDFEGDGIIDRTIDNCSSSSRATFT